MNNEEKQTFTKLLKQNSRDLFEKSQKSVYYTTESIIEYSLHTHKSRLLRYAGSLCILVF